MNLIKASILLVITVVAFACNSTAPKTESEQGQKSSASSACSMSACCDKSSQGAIVADDISNTKVQVYYFHGTRRCATCKAVEEVAKEAVAQNFSDQVGFLSVNSEEESVLTGKYKISGQTLLVVCGDKISDLTSEAFLNARTNPEKLTEKLVNTIKPLL